MKKVIRGVWKCLSQRETFAKKSGERAKNAHKIYAKVILWRCGQFRRGWILFSTIEGYLLKQASNRYFLSNLKSKPNCSRRCQLDGTWFGPGLLFCSMTPNRYDWVKRARMSNATWRGFLFIEKCSSEGFNAPNTA